MPVTRAPFRVRRACAGGVLPRMLALVSGVHLCGVQTHGTLASRASCCGSRCSSARRVGCRKTHVDLPVSHTYGVKKLPCPCASHLHFCPTLTSHIPR